VKGRDHFPWKRRGCSRSGGRRRTGLDEDGEKSKCAIFAAVWVGGGGEVCTLKGGGGGKKASDRLGEKNEVCHLHWLNAAKKFFYCRDLAEKKKGKKSWGFFRWCERGEKKGWLASAHSLRGEKKKKKGVFGRI